MITYCPTCANMLLVELTVANKDLRWYCDTCPYEYTITSKVAKSAPLVHKPLEDVLGGKEAWANAPKVGVVCQGCRHNQAYRLEVQVRSSDEPTTCFYKCVECEEVQREAAELANMR